jgi:hypothetical protein
MFFSSTVVKKKKIGVFSVSLDKKSDHRSFDIFEAFSWVSFKKKGGFQDFVVGFGKKG